MSLRPIRLPSARIRPAREADLPAIQAIHAWHVRHGTATFDHASPELDTWRERLRQANVDGLPWLVLEQGADIFGYTFAAPAWQRASYRHTLESAIYLRPGMEGQGLGQRLLGALLQACADGPWRQVLGLIGDSANHAAIALYQRLGFEKVGVLRGVGFSHGRWLDSVLMQRALSPAEPAPERR
ncbi:MAG: Phosphinothricin N-acetyltransferase [Stenotrophomonas maltophilia]|nr:MAG: Phosphinothricin N-acetyltransferase [Stenotrophomonas maltophilia]